MRWHLFAAIALTLAGVAATIVAAYWVDSYQCDMHGRYGCISWSPANQDDR